MGEIVWNISATDPHHQTAFCVVGAPLGETGQGIAEGFRTSN